MAKTDDREPDWPILHQAYQNTPVPDDADRVVRRLALRGAFPQRGAPATRGPDPRRLWLWSAAAAAVAVVALAAWPLHRRAAPPRVAESPAGTVRLGPVGEPTPAGTADAPAATQHLPAGVSRPTHPADSAPDSASPAPAAPPSEPVTSPAPQPAMPAVPSVLAQIDSDGRLRRYLGDSLFARLAVIVADAADHGAPVAPLGDRALEGLASQAEPALIVAGVGRYATRLVRAADALGAGATADEIAAGAAALASGSTPAMLARIRASRPGAPMLVPLLSLTQLATAGVPPDTAADAIVLFAERHIAESELASLTRAVTTAAASGGSAMSAFTRQVETVTAAVQPTPSNRGPTIPVSPPPAGPRPFSRSPGDRP